MDPKEKSAWIFVSHASADLPQVRQVRNYLESQGGAPLLFHLRALVQPEEFWPIIEREILARNFFLYCESPNAERSDWVQRERRTVEELGKQRKVRVGSIRVDQPIELKTLNRFLGRYACLSDLCVDGSGRCRPLHSSNHRGRISGI